MYRLLLLFSMISCAYVMVLYFRTDKANRSDWKRYFSIREMMFRCSGSQTSVQDITVRERIFCSSIILSVFSFILLAITGIIPVLITGLHLSGTFLILHVTVAPLFVLSATVSILYLVHRMRMDKYVWETTRDKSKNMLTKTNSESFKKIEFWLAYLLVIGAIMAIILMMYPLFGPDGQDFLLDLHRYSTLALFLIFQHRIYVHVKKHVRN